MCGWDDMFVSSDLLEVHWETCQIAVPQRAPQPVTEQQIMEYETSAIPVDLGTLGELYSQDERDDIVH